MKTSHIKTSIAISSLVLLSAVTTTHGSLASDNASNYSSWGNGDNQGSGFQPWELSALDGGNFLGAAALQGANNAALDTSGQSFGIWATGFSVADRPLSSALAIGETLSFSLAYQFDNGNRGFNLFSSDSQIFNFNINSAGYTWTGGGSAPTTALPGIRENGVVISAAFTGTVLGFDYLFTSAQDPNLITSGSIITGAVDEIDFYVSGAGGGTGGDLYFNNLNVVPEPSTYTLIAGFLVLGCALYRRRSTKI